MGLSQYLATFGSIGTALSLQLYQSKSIECETIKFELSEKISALQADLDSKIQELENFDKVNEGYVKEIQSASAQNVKSLESDIEALKVSKVSLEEQVSSFKREIADLTRQVEDHKTKAQALEAAVSSAEKERDGAKANFEFELHSKIDDLIAEKDFTIQKLTEKCSEVDAVRAKLEEAFNKDRFELREKLTSLENTLVAKTSELEKSSSEAKHLHDETVRLESENGILKSQVDELKSASEAAEEERAKVAEISKELEAAKERLDQVETFKQQLGALTETHSHGKLEFGEKESDFSVTKDYFESLLNKITVSSDEITELKKQASKHEENEKALQSKLDKSVSEIKDQLESTTASLKAQLAEAENALTQRQTDVKLYNVVKGQIDQLFEKIKGNYAEIENIEVDDEEYEIEETLEVEAPTEQEEKSAVDDASSREASPDTTKKGPKTTTILKGNSETRKTTQILKAFEDMKRAHEDKNDQRERINNGLVEKLKELTQKIADQDKQQTTIKGDLAKQQELVATYKSQIQQLQDTENKLKQEIKEHKENEQRMEELCGTLKQKDDKITTQIEQMREENKILLAARLKWDEKIVDEDNRNRQLNEENVDLKQQLQSQNQEIGHLKAQIQALQEKEKIFESSALEVQRILTAQNRRVADGQPEIDSTPEKISAQ